MHFHGFHLLHTVIPALFDVELDTVQLLPDNIQLLLQLFDAG